MRFAARVVFVSVLTGCSGSGSGVEPPDASSSDASVDLRDGREIRRALRAQPLELRGPKVAAVDLLSPPPNAAPGGSLLDVAPSPVDLLPAEKIVSSRGFRSDMLARPIEPLVDAAGRYAIRRRELAAFFQPKGFALNIPEPRKDGKPGGAWNLLVDVVGGAEPTPIAEAAKAGRSHRFGATTEAGVPQFGQLAWEEIYPGVDMVIVPGRAGFSYRFLASPGADVSRIKLAWNGAKALRVSDDGAKLEVETGIGTLAVDALHVYEQIGDEKHELEARHVVHGLESSVEVKGWTGKGTLVIDPSVWWASYFADDGNEVPGKIATDSAGNVYIVGYTDGSYFPTTGGYDKVFGGGNDAFVAKFTSTGSLSWSTYLGGAGADYGNDIAVDSTGALIVVGETSSDGLATTGVYDTTRVLSEAFVAKLSAANGQPTWFTYLGGSTSDRANSVAIDGSNNIYVTGSTSSTDFPTTTGVFKTTNAGGTDAFLTKLNSAGGVGFSTYLGGGATDNGNGVAVDSTAAYVVGTTGSSNFNGVGGAPLYDNGFITKISSTGVHQWSKYIGGNGGDGASAVAVVPTSGRIVVVGYCYDLTGAANYSHGNTDAYMASFTTAGAMDNAVYLGGSNFDAAYDVAADAAGTLYIVGSTNSSNFPNVGGLTNGTVSGRRPVPHQDHRHGHRPLVRDPLRRHGWR